MKIWCEYLSQVLCINGGASRMVNLVQKRIQETEIYMFKTEYNAEISLLN